MFKIHSMAAIRDLQSLYAPYKKFEPSDVEELKQLLFQEVEEHFNQLISDYENVNLHSRLKHLFQLVIHLE